MTKTEDELVKIRKLLRILVRHFRNDEQDFDPKELDVKP